VGQVIGSSPISSTKNKKSTQAGGLFVFRYGIRDRTRTHSSGTVRGTVPATSANTGGYNDCRVLYRPPQKSSQSGWLFSLSSGRPLAVGQVISSSPISSTKNKKSTQAGGLFCYERLQILQNSVDKSGEFFIIYKVLRKGGKIWISCIYSKNYLVW